jgi:hypothetical protein
MYLGRHHHLRGKPKHHLSADGLLLSCPHTAGLQSGLAHSTDTAATAEQTARADSSKPADPTEARATAESTALCKTSRGAATGRSERKSG